jgi:class 3 adenylate cyclase/tetratricopeptide (TPR) repeat protein
MQCPKCQAENNETAKFCSECGHKFEIKCPSCGHSVMPSAKFCEDCGQPLSDTSKSIPKDLTFDEKLAKIQKYIPGNITEKILSQRNRIEGERKQVSVLFTDMAGYTTMSEKLDAEEVYSLMDQVYEILIHKVTEYGGTVNEFTGDGIMALFGAPIALEDAPQRAIRASLAIHREIVQFNERMRREKPGHIPLRMRAGIHTGPVVVGTVGNDLRVTFTAIGDTVNLASRMETLAEPGSTCVSEDTFKLTEGLFRFEGLGEQEIKGKEKPVSVYRVIAPSTSRTRFDVSAERGLTPFVGRERERELLLDAFERARQGRGQAVSIVSEAGMGKSRLLYEFRKAILNEDVTFLEGKCLSFGRGVAYQPITDILKSNFDIREDDWDPVIRNKVTQGLQTISVEEGPAMPYLLELLSVKDSGIEKITMSPEGKKDKTIETLKRIILKGSEMRPLVMAIEDLHWIDKTSEDVLKYLLESIAGARVLLILTYRPEFIPSWGARSYHNQLLLNRLSNRESLFMATHILGREQIPPVPPLPKGGMEVGTPLLRGGIEFDPLLNGEKDVGTLKLREGQEFVPPLLKGYGTGQIPPLLKGGGGDFRDSLGEVQMETALEEVILEKTEGIPFFVEEFIKSLKDLGFIERKDATYRISKSLQTIHIPSTIQDIIMARVDALPEGAKELLQVGSLIEREFSYKLIKAAMHLPEEDLLRRLSFLKDAELLYERGLFPDSTFIFKHALTREVVYGTLLERKKKEWHLDIGQAVEEVYRENLEEMYSSLGEHFEEGGDYEKASQYFALAARKARRASVFTDAIALSKKTVACLEKLPQNIEVQKQIIDARITLANLCLNINQEFEARDAVAPIIELVQQLDYRKRLPAIYVIMAAYLICVEERYDDEETHWYLREAKKLAQENKDLLSLWNAHQFEGHAQSNNCEFAEGEASFLRLIEMAEAAGNVFGVAFVKSHIAPLIYDRNGRINEALKCGQEALQLALRADDTYLKGLAYGACGSALFEKGLFLEAEEDLTLALEFNQKTDFVGALFSNFLLLGSLRFEMGRYQEAQECCNGLLAVYDRVRVWPSLTRLAQLLKVAAGIRGGLNPGLDAVLNFDLKEIRIKWLKGSASLTIGGIYLYLDDKHMDEAEAWIKKAIEVDEQYKMPWNLARDYAFHAEFFKKKGDSAQAKEKLTKAIDLMSSIGADGWVKRYEEELAGL